MNAIKDITALAAHFPVLDGAAAARFAADAPAALASVPGLGAALHRIAGVQGTDRPRTKVSLLCLFAASHGFAAGAAEATADEVAALSGGQVPLTKLCGQVGAGLRVLDLAVKVPTLDMRLTPAMTDRDVAATLAFGMEATAAGGDLLGLGAIAAGSELAARLVARGLLDLDAETALEGCPDFEFGAAKQAFDRHGDRHGDPLSLVAAYGGRELAALVGAIAAARVQGLPVIADGIVGGVAAALAARLLPGGADHVVHAGLPANALGAAIRFVTGAPGVLDGGEGRGRGEAAAFTFGLLAGGAALTPEAQGCSRA